MSQSEYLCGYCRMPLDETTETLPNGEAYEQLTCINSVCAFYGVSKSKN